MNARASEDMCSIQTEGTVEVSVESSDNTNNNMVIWINMLETNIECSLVETLTIFVQNRFVQTNVLALLYCY